MLTAERLRELLDYDPETGVFTRRTSTGGRPAGTVAGYKQRDDRIFIYVDGKNLKAHRLAWLHVHGQWPTHDIDHINGNPSDNRLANLRDVPHRINQQNRQGPTKANRSGMIGVTANHARFMAQIKINGQQTYIGTFDTPEEAHSAYLEKKRAFHEGNTL